MTKANLTVLLIILSLFAYSQHDTTITYYPNGKVAMRYSSLNLENIYDLKSIVHSNSGTQKSKPVLELFYDNGKRALLIDQKAKKYKTFFDTGGPAADLEVIKNGYRVKLYGRNGRLLEIINYDTNFVRNGEYTQYYPNGKVAVKGWYRSDPSYVTSIYSNTRGRATDKVNIWKTFYLNGKTALEENYAPTVKYDTVFGSKGDILEEKAVEVEIMETSETVAARNREKEEREALRAKQRKEGKYYFVPRNTIQKKMKAYDRNGRLLTGIDEMGMEKMADTMYVHELLQVLHDSVVTRDIKATLLDENILNRSASSVVNGTRLYTSTDNKLLTGYIVVRARRNLIIDRLTDGALEKRYRGFQMEDGLMASVFSPSHPGIATLWPDAAELGELTRVLENTRATEFQYRDKMKVNIIPNIINYIKSFETPGYRLSNPEEFRPTLIIEKNDSKTKRYAERLEEVKY